MFLKLSHMELDIYNISKAFALECYRITNSFPSQEKFGIISQIRRAALSVHLNISEGFSRKSIAERKRFYEIARGSIIEIDAALEIAVELNYIKNGELEELGKLMLRSFQMISKLILK